MDFLTNFFKYYTSNDIRGGVKNFSPQHFAWLCIALMVLMLAVRGYKGLSIKSRQTVMKLSAILMIILYLQRSIWAASLGFFKANSMLPFHLCGIMVFLEFIAIFWGNKYIKEFVYCAGLPGAALALITPELNGYPLFSFQYQAFILAHLFLIAIPLLWIFGDHYVPDRRYMIKSYKLLCFLALFDGIMNSFLNSNYMFVSKAPPNTPFVAVQTRFGYLGYLIFLIIFSFIAMRMMYLPWRRKQSKFINETEYK